MKCLHGLLATQKSTLNMSREEGRDYKDARIQKIQRKRKNRRLKKGRQLMKAKQREFLKKSGVAS